MSAKLQSPNWLRKSIVGLTLLLSVSVLTIGCSINPGTRSETEEEAFLKTMVSHHQTEIQIARIAGSKPASDSTGGLTSGMEAKKRREIEQMRAIYQRLFQGDLEPDAGSYLKLGLSAADAGMAHSVQFAPELRSSKPFDRALIDELIPLDLGAIRMARVVAEHSRDKELRQFALTMISNATREIIHLNAYRVSNFGDSYSDSSSPENPAR